MHSLIFGAKNSFERARHEPISTLLVGTAAVLSEAGAVVAPATAGLIGAGGSVTAGGLASAALSGVSLASGIVGKVAGANHAAAQAKVFEQQAKLAEQREIQRDQAIIGKEHANAAASGLSASSGSPLATTLDSTQGLKMNAAAARYPGEISAWDKRLAAQSGYAAIPGMILDGAQSLFKDRSVLSSFMQPSSGALQTIAPSRTRTPRFIYGGDPLGRYTV
jgi:hypothetical protein